MDKVKTVIELGDHMYQFVINGLDDEIDLDELTQIQYDNIYAEAITISTLLNKVGILKAQAEEEAKIAAFDCKVYYAQIYETKQKQLYSDYVSHGGRKPTKDDYENACLIDRSFILKKKDVYRKEKYAAFMDAVYWSVKDKSKKIETISNKLAPEEFEHEILEQTINLVTIKRRVKRIK